jgi:hypothetical protein
MNFYMERKWPVGIKRVSHASSASHVRLMALPPLTPQCQLSGAHEPLRFLIALVHYFHLSQGRSSLHTDISLSFIHVIICIVTYEGFA